MVKRLRIPISIVLVIWCFASCSSNRKSAGNVPSSGVESSSLEGTEWNLEDLAGTAVLPNSQPTLAFPEPGKTAGNSSCNRFMGSVKIGSSTIKFEALASTRMACLDEKISAQETSYLKALGAATHYGWQDSYLLIYVEGYDKPLRFSRSIKPKA